MLDTTTKRKIDSAKNILVGIVPNPMAQVEQITTALIYKFMDDMDSGSEKIGGVARYFKNGYEKLRWSKLLDKRLSGHERLDLYVRAITSFSKNQNLPQLFRDIFKDSFLPYRNPEALSLFLKEIDGFTYDNSENLGDAFEYLLSILGSQGDAGQFRTPRHIIDFIVEVVDPKKNETILDPACGTAGFLISAYKHILKKNTISYSEFDLQVSDKKIALGGNILTPSEKKKLMDNFTGYDISPDMVKLSLVNMFLHDLKEPKIYEYDTLASEERWNEQFDVILANPPFMSPKGGIRPHKKFSVQATRSEVLFVDYILEHLNLNGRAGIIVPEGIIFKNETAYKKLRQMLIEDGLFAVVSLPSGVFNPYAGVKTSILFFDNTLSNRTKEILFIKIENDGYDLGAQRRKIEKNDLIEALIILEAWKQSRKKKTDIALWVKKEKIAESGDYNLTGERYREVEVRKNQKWPEVELGKLISLIRGVTYSKSDEVQEKGFKILRANNISLDSDLVLDDIKEISKNLILKDEKKLLGGDIFICLASGSKDHIGKVAFIEKDIEYFFGGFMGVIRVNTDKILSKFLFYLIKGQKFNKYLRTAISGVNINNLNNKILGKYKIPLPPLEVQKEIVEQIEVKQNAINHAKEVIKNLEKERKYFGEKIGKMENIKWVKLGDVCKTTSGGTPLKDKREYYEKGTIPWLKSGEVNQGFIYSSKEMITEAGLKNSSSKIFPVNTVLIAMYGATAGKVGILKFKSATNQAICGILPNEKFIPEFLYLFLKTKTSDMVKMSGGGAQPNISQSIIKKLDVPFPSLEIQKQLVAEIEKEEEIIAANRRLIELMERKIEGVLEGV